MVELLVDGIWQDITGLVMVRDSGNISIKRGQTSEGSSPDPGSCDLQMNNRDGRFSPNNPMSIYYGKIGRNTQIRVSVPKGDDKSLRFWGEVSEWPEDWDVTDTDRWVDVTAAGILRRLRQNNTPLGSSMFRGFTSSDITDPVAYWPCEDGPQSTYIASAVGGPAMVLRGAPNLGSDTGYLCSGALPVMNNGSFSGDIPAYTVTGKTQVRFLMYLPSSLPDLTQLVRVGSTGSATYWTVAYGTGGTLYLQGFSSDGTTVLFDSGALAFGVDTERALVSMELTQNGPDIQWALAVDVIGGSALATGATFSSATVGMFTYVTVDPGLSVPDGVFGHIAVQPDVTSLSSIHQSLIAHVGETASGRLQRLCSEQSVNFTFLAPVSTDTMGPQLPEEFLTLLQECVDVDQGILFERETAFGLAYKSRNFLYNESPRASFSYTDAHLSDIPRPVPDAKLVQNQVTASRPQGSSAVATQETGPLSIQPPPFGVGLYADAPTLNLELDSDLPLHAQWRVHLGTVDEPRYPAISVNLARPEVASLRFDALDVLFGSRITVSGVPSRLGGDLSLLVIGIQETLTLFEHRITYVCQPYSPYLVAVAGTVGTSAKADTSGSTLAADMAPSDTSVSVATVSGDVWTTSAGDFPFDVTVTGEQMTVTGITGTTSPQTFTVTRSVNGVVKTHQAGESVSLTDPAIVAL
jgi:hypothetical protein